MPFVEPPHISPHCPLITSVVPPKRQTSPSPRTSFPKDLCRGPPGELSPVSFCPLSTDLLVGIGAQIRAVNPGSQPHRRDFDSRKSASTLAIPAVVLAASAFSASNYLHLNQLDFRERLRLHFRDARSRLLIRIESNLAPSPHSSVANLPLILLPKRLLP